MRPGQAPESRDQDEDGSSAGVGAGQAEASAAVGPTPALRGGGRRSALGWAGLAALSLVFVVLLERTGLPAALLLGPMAAGVLFSIGGARIELPALPFRFAQAIIGCMIARVLALPVLQEIVHDWPVLLAGVLSVVVASSTLGWTLARLNVLPGTTALWGSSPGAASAMTLMAGSFGGDMRLVAVMQYTRVVIVATLAAVFARLWADPAAAAPAVQWLAAPDWPWLLATLALAAGAVVAGRFLPIPAAPILVPLGVGTLLQDVGLLRIELPQPLLAAAYLAIGWGIGLRFDRAVIRHAARAMPAILGSIACLVTVCAGFAALLVVFAGTDPLTAYLAMSPGGADSVAIIASSANVDVAFVMSMQTARLLVCFLTGPFLARALSVRMAARDAARAKAAGPKP